MINDNRAQLREAVRISRARQGLGPVVTDPATLVRVAALILGAPADPRAVSGQAASGDAA